MLVMQFWKNIDQTHKTVSATCRPVARYFHRGRGCLPQDTGPIIGHANSEDTRVLGGSGGMHFRKISRYEILNLLEMH